MKVNIWKEFKKVFSVARKEFLIKLVSSLILRGVLLAIPVLFSMSVNYATKGDYINAMLYIIFSILVTIFYRLTEGVNQRLYYNLYTKIYCYYNYKGIDKTADNSTFSLSRFNLGQYTNMLTTDVDVITAFFASGVIRFAQLLEFLIIFGWFWSLDIFFFITAFALTLIIAFIIPIAGRKTENLNSEKKHELDKLTMSIHEYFKNIKEIKCFNIFNQIAPIAKSQAKKYEDANANYIVAYYWNNQFFLLSVEIFRLLSVGYGIALVAKGNLEIGSLLIIYNYYQKIIDNLSTMLTINVEYTNLKVSLERFNHLIEYSSDRKIKETSQEFITDGKIEFKDILYGYKNNPTLKNVSLEIQPNSLTVITGKAGTGKTGVLDLLLKLNRQHQGVILIDGTDINNIPDEEYFSKVSLLRKNSTLFSMSIKDNFELVEKDQNKIVDVCTKLGIHNDIVKLKDSYNTQLGEHDSLPESLKQLIAIARIILKGSKIMLFDDALLGLDDEEQNRVMNMLNELKRNHTIVMITHDYNILKDAENIIVMDARSVVETGNLNELIAKKGAYCSLFESSVKQY